MDNHVNQHFNVVHFGDNIDSRSARTAIQPTENMSKSLQTLPTELLQHIFDLLPPVGRLTLVITCRRFYVSFQHAIPELNNDERFEFQCLYEYDQGPSLKVAACGGCLTVHHKCFFSDLELQKRPLVRCCLRSARQLWVNPDRAFSFDDVLRARKWEPGAPRGSLEFIIGGSAFPFEEAAMAERHSLLQFPANKSISKQHIAAVLSGFDLPACPHMTLGHPAIANSFDPSKHLHETGIGLHFPFYAKRKPDAQCRFRGCSTSFFFTTHPDRITTTWRTVYLHVYRTLGLMRSPSDPKWLSQLIIIPDEGRLRQYCSDCFAWKEANMKIQKERFNKEILLDSLYLASCPRPTRYEAEFRERESRRDQQYHPHRASMLNTSTVNSRAGSEELYTPSYQPSPLTMGLGARIRSTVWSFFA